MKTRSWIGMVMLWSLALGVQAADAPGQGPGTPAPPPAPALEAPPAPALETPAPAQEAPSPILVPETPARPATPPAAPPQPNQPPPRPTTAVLTSVPMSGQAIVKEDRVNLRSRPVLNSEVVGQLNKGDQVEILERISGESSKAGEPAHWFKIVLPKTNFVWLNSKFVDAASRTVSTTRLNVRSGPGENHDVLGRLEKGASIHELEVKGEWLKIQAPAGSYAHIAAHLVDKGAELAGLPKSTPAPAPPPAPTPTAVEATGASADVPPPIVSVAETAKETEATPVEPQLVKRVVSREGIVRRTVSIQAPTEFALENSETRKMVNYLFNPVSSGVVLRNFEGQRILVTGEELLDDRWPNTPVMNIEKVKARP